MGAEVGVARVEIDDIVFDAEYGLPVYDDFARGARYFILVFVHPAASPGERQESSGARPRADIPSPSAPGPKHGGEITDERLEEPLARLGGGALDYKP